MEEDSNVSRKEAYKDTKKKDGETLKRRAKRNSGVN